MASLRFASTTRIQSSNPSSSVEFEVGSIGEEGDDAPVLKARRFDEEGEPSSELSRTLLRSAFMLLALKVMKTMK